MSEKKKRAPRYAVTQLIEVTRSFEYKPPGMRKYESAGFGCVATTQATREDATRTAEMLDAFCRAEVRKSLQAFLVARALKINPITDGPGPVAIVEPAAAEDVTFTSPVRKRAKKETNATDLHDARRAY